VSPRADRLLAVGVVFVALLVGAAFVASNWTGSVPAGAATTPIARTALEGDVDPDPDPEVQPSVTLLSPSGQECLGRLSNPAGYMDLCWSVWRTPDGDAAKDYYTLRLYGTVGGSGSGIRWWALRADLVGEPGDNVFQGWPSGDFDGACAQQVAPVTSPSGAELFVDLCHRTRGMSNDGWQHFVQWTCTACLLPDHSDREIALFVEVGVAQGTVPEWDIGADFGG
jgi:hypothetical protein